MVSHPSDFRLHLQKVEMLVPLSAEIRLMPVEMFVEQIVPPSVRLYV